MNIEYEARILNINKQEMIQKLEELQEEFKWEKLQRRYVYDFQPALPNKWIRLRTNGFETTLTIKDITSNKMDGTKELEITVDDFEKTASLLKELGYNPKAFQENKRRRYYLNNVEIDIDSWPQIPDYIEVEGKNEEEVLKTIELLGFSKKDIVTADVETIYKEYGIDLPKIEYLELENDRK